MTWNDGYVTEVQYTHGFYRELTPAMLDFARLAKGMRPPLKSKGLSYFELGCGQGFSANLLAAANPHIQFHANDFNPSQILGARRLAQEGQVKNIHFYELSFLELLTEPTVPDEIDYIALHGIYSWISEENRDYIIQFINKKLAPGGVVYVSYNALPGWAAAMPMRQFILDRSQKSSGSVTAKVEDALRFLDRMVQVKAAYFDHAVSTKNRIGTMNKVPTNYIIHEYLNQNWAPEYFKDVASFFQQAKLEFVGSANLVEQVDEMGLTPEMLAILNEESDLNVRESLRDFMLNQDFRKDVYAKGLENYDPLAERDAWNRVRFTLSSPKIDLPLKVRIKTADVTLPDEAIRPIIDALSVGSCTMKELMERDGPRSLGWKNVEKVLKILVGNNNVQPSVGLSDPDRRTEAADNFNNAIMKRAEASSELGWLASPVTGGGVAIDRFSQLFISALRAKRENPVLWIWDVLDSQDQRIIKDGKVIQTKEETVSELQNREKKFREEGVPLYQRLGIL